jgi:transcriptional regulator with XRE-family HTH domain
MASVNTLRERREALGLTRDKLAGQADISAVHVWRLEKDKSLPTLAVAQRIARVLDCFPEDIWPELEEVSA